MAAQSSSQIPEPPLARFLFADTKLSLVWLLLRLYIGYEWAVAGWEKVTNPAWFGPAAGAPLTGFLMGALKKTAGAHPDVSGWYGAFLQSSVIPNANLFSNMVAVGELLVGIALILGIFTGIAAFFGAFMNMNYLFAGTVSTNPFMFVIQLFIIMAWRVAGYYGLDRFLLPKLGTPWQKGSLFKPSKSKKR
ncbi:MAG: DoxX family membrane protein [Candidatus Levyibacteriota bacterium]